MFSLIDVYVRYKTIYLSERTNIPSELMLGNFDPNHQLRFDMRNQCRWYFHGMWTSFQLSVVDNLIQLAGYYKLHIPEGTI